MPHNSFLAAAVLCTVALPAICAAQTVPQFFNYKTPANTPSSNLYSADLNNDGRPDVIADTSHLPNGFSVYLSNGDGTFKAPVFHAVSDGSIAPTPMAIADFNNDGKADVAVALTGASPARIAVYLGNGDGTFQSPKYSTLQVPSGDTFNSAPLAAADFNRDGKIDLVGVAGTGNNQTVFILAGDGSGGFNSPRAISSLPSDYVVQNMGIGDFDGDARADIAFTAVYGCAPTGSCTTVVHALFGDGSFGFQETTPYNTYSPLQISAGDLNSDGRTDLIGYDPSTEQMITFYGQTDRVFASYSFTISNMNGHFANGWYGPFQIGDFNGDGHMDIAGHFANNVTNGTDYGILFFLGTATPGQFSQDFLNIPASSTPSDPFGTPPVAVDENRDAKPDLAVFQTPGPDSTGSSNPSPVLIGSINTTSSGNWGGCNDPATSHGILLCSPSSSSSSTSVSFKAAATSFGDLRKIELWVDGKKLSENFHAWEHNAWFNYTGTFVAGSHQATLYAADVDNRLQSRSFAFTVGSSGTCSAPSGYGVNVCSPVNGSTVASPVTVQASAHIAGTLARMEVWVDGVKKYTETAGTSFSTTIALASGSHRFDIYAVNTAGTKYESSVTAAVK